MKPRIYINGRFLTQRITGVQRVAIELVKALDKIVEPGEFEILTPPGVINSLDLKNIKITTIGTKSNNIWVQWTFPLYVMKKKAFALTISGLCPILKPDYFVAHDVTLVRYPESFTFLYRLFYVIGYKLSLKRCKHIFTVSYFSKKELEDVFGIRDGEITVIYNAAQMEETNRIDTDILKKYNLQANDFYLSVGSQSMHKNQKYIYELAKKYPKEKFVVVGGKSAQSLNEVDFNLSDNTVFTGYLENDELVDIYGSAKGFIFPSLYEGFGIPPLEAITLGVKRIALSDIPVFREVYPKGTYFFDPLDPNSFDINDFLETSISKKDFEYYRNKYSWSKSALICLKKIME